MSGELKESVRHKRMFSSCRIVNDRKFKSVEMRLTSVVMNNKHHP